MNENEVYEALQMAKKLLKKIHAKTKTKVTTPSIVALAHTILMAQAEMTKNTHRSKADSVAGAPKKVPPKAPAPKPKAQAAGKAPKPKVSEGFDPVREEKKRPKAPFMG